MELSRRMIRMAGLLVGVFALLYGVLAPPLGSQPQPPPPTPPPPEPKGPFFEITAYDMPPTAKVGEEVTITATIKNTGDERGRQTVRLAISGVVVAQESLVLSPGQSKNLSFRHTFDEPGDFTVTISTEDDSVSATITVAAAEVRELALIHSSQGLFPAKLSVKRGIPVRLFNTSLDVAHDPVIIRDPETGALAFGTAPFSVKPGELTIIEFIPDQAGEYEITHELHGCPARGKLIVRVSM